MSVQRAFKLFDCLVSPVALYACEFWFPHVLPIIFFCSKTCLLAGWESFKCETINQQCSRLILSVHRKASRLAILGELGRYPMAIKALAHTLNYRLCLAKKPANSLIGLAMAEMRVMAQQGKDCWLTRTNKMAEMLNLSCVPYSKSSGQKVLQNIRAVFINSGWMRFHPPELDQMENTTISC